jgi:nucleoside-diphosphate-sugar epimerase
MTQPLVLVIGRADFLGGRLCQLLQPLGYHVRLLDIDVRDPRMLNQAMHGANSSFTRPTPRTVSARGPFCRRPSVRA